MRENTCMTSKEFERCALSILLVLSTTEIDSYQSVTAIDCVTFSLSNYQRGKEFLAYDFPVNIKLPFRLSCMFCF